MESSCSTPQSPSTYSDSSRTGSSGPSGDEAKDAEGDDLNSEDVSPIDLECHIQAERITKILDEAVYKSRLALCIPYLVHEYKPLKTIISIQNYEDLIFICEQYENPLFSASLLNLAALEDIQAGDLSLKNRMNPELGHLMYIIGSYPELKPVVETKITEIIRDHQHKNLKRKQESKALEYLHLLEHFRELMKVQMSITAAKQLATKISTRKLEISNKKLVEAIKGYNEAIIREKREFEETMVRKHLKIAKLEQDLVNLQREASSKLKKKILDSDRQMVLASRAHAVKSEMLNEEATEVKESFDNLLRRHISDEKNQRARKFKVETQLMSWLQKYDTDIGEKQMEMDEFTKLVEDELKKTEELEAELAELDLQYIPLMAEREEEYQQEMTVKMIALQTEHAARVIQHAWRTVVSNRDEKKKLQKKIQKMKAAQAAAERKAAAEAKAAKLQAKANKKKK